MIDVLKLTHKSEIDGLVREKCNSSALAMELRLSCTDPSRYGVSVVISKSGLCTNYWKPESCHNANFVLTGDTAGCYDRQSII